MAAEPARFVSGRPARDAGFSLMEVVVGFFVLALIAVAATSLLVNSVQTSGSDRQRVRAAQVAAEEVDILRAQYQSNPQSVRSAIAAAPVVDREMDGIGYEVRRAVAGETLTISVEWADMDGVQPVTNAAVLAVLSNAATGSSSPAGAGGVTPPTISDPGTALRGGVLAPLYGVTNQPLSVSNASLCNAPLLGSVLSVPPLNILCLLAGPAPTPTPSATPTPTCPSGTALTTLTVTEKTGLLTLPLVAGTVTATRAATSACETALSVSVPIAAGTGLAALPYGHWTFSVNGLTAVTSWPTATISTPVALGVSVAAK